MISDGHPARHFLVEWYGAALTGAPVAHTAACLQAGAAAASLRGGPITLELTLAAPADEVLYGVFRADCAESVARACRHAGWIPDRITADIRPHLICAATPPGTAS